MRACVFVRARVLAGGRALDLSPLDAGCLQQGICTASQILLWQLASPPPSPVTPLSHPPTPTPPHPHPQLTA